MAITQASDQYIDRFGTDVTRIKVREGSTDDRGVPTQDLSDTETIPAIPDARSPSVRRFQSGPHVEADLILYVKSTQTVDDAASAPDGWADQFQIYGDNYEVIDVQDNEIHLEKMRDE